MKIFCLLIGMLACPLLLHSQKGVSADEFYQALQTYDEAILLDVRIEAEYLNSRLPDAIYAGEKAILLDHLKPLSSDIPILVYCDQESRSLAVLKILRRKGFKNCIYLKGGFGKWKKKGFPVDDSQFLIQIENEQ